MVEPSLNASLKKRETEALRMRKRYLRASTSKLGVWNRGGATGVRPAPRHVGDAACAVGASSPAIGRAGIHGAEACQQDRPVVVVELVREEEGAREPVVLRAVVAVVLMRGDGVD